MKMGSAMPSQLVNGHRHITLSIVQVIWFRYIHRAGGAADRAIREQWPGDLSRCRIAPSKVCAPVESSLRWRRYGKPFCGFGLTDWSAQMMIITLFNVQITPAQSDAFRILSWIFRSLCLQDMNRPVFEISWQRYYVFRCSTFCH